MIDKLVVAASLETFGLHIVAPAGDYSCLFY